MTEVAESIEKSEYNRFQILSLDGGGIKGLFSAAVLAAIEEDLNINIIDHFDLITGTSTGGIIALGLGLGMRPMEIVEFYLSKGPEIFPRWYGLKWVQHWVYRKYSQEAMMKALRDCFKDKRLADSKKRLVIPTYNIGEDDVYIFRTPHHARLKRDYKVEVWKIALATSAAPTFFPCCRQVDNIRLVDGGVWANNPIMVGIVESYGTLNIPLEKTWAFSIGTSDAVAHRRRRLNSGGILAWAFENAAIDVIIRGQSIAANNQAHFLLGEGKIERLNPRVAADEFSLDGTEKAKDLIGKALHYARKFRPIFEGKFLAHKAQTYTPIYT